MEDHRHISHTAAAARLRMAGDVRKRARRALMLPPFALLVLGVVFGLGLVAIRVSRYATESHAT